MIQELLIDNQIIKYKLNYKNNKNTYFYFRKAGYIQINASKRQSKKKILAFITKNKKTFIKKYNNSLIRTTDDSYYLFGTKYQTVKDENIKNIIIDHSNNVVYEPFVENDKLKQLYKNIEKTLLLNKLNELKQKYLTNDLIDISSITFKTRYMNTRFGSCNPSKQNININLYLTHYEEKYLEYVFLHEITHLTHQNHSIDFYELLSKLSKDYSLIKKELNNKFIQR